MSKSSSHFKDIQEEQREHKNHFDDGMDEEESTMTRARIWTSRSTAIRGPVLTFVATVLEKMGYAGNVRSPCKERKIGEDRQRELQHHHRPKGQEP